MQVPWDIARSIVHSNADIGMSGVVSHLCAVCGFTIASGCAGGEGDCVTYVAVPALWEHVGGIGWP